LGEEAQSTAIRRYGSQGSGTSLEVRSVGRRDLQIQIFDPYQVFFIPITVCFEWKVVGDSEVQVREGAAKAV
jgi:hypothetical protein